MAGDQVCDGSNMSVSLQIDNPSRDSLWIPTSSIAFYGAKSMVNFENDGGGDTLDKPFFQASVKEENGDEDFDVCLNPPGKKRRLTASQVQFLERNFEVENKLEPERKIQLAKELGLQPRQVAIWFQNRRARFKNKQLEKDYDSLKTSYDRLKVDYDNLLKEKEDLKNELVSLKAKLLAREEGIENLEPIEAMNSPNVELQNPVPKTVPEVVSDASLLVTPKQEEASSAKSDVFDSDSPHSFLEPGDSSHIFEPDQSDFSQDEEDELSRSFLPTPYFPKLYHDPPANSCSYGFPVEDQPFWSWT
ncbi:hypothetical protein P3X46_015422 [Hevea brasiliensis]|uniref:Homeobox-leucine zipper protein n=1 Tax=Hevea brasiliensis TaxID=3981 RepID=A0ABQ9LZX4_HEVBR|nr:homeobox-leucine zipper protein HAT5 [Hevea brasiliensis]XP_021685375.2 homeobox-leucine zipper protein HAT5 [Hevea brasiliensis]XP_058008823.1 homeobox-leucine zipper protein HAT5 [Hevea brasiliensis]KAJ9172146.1 hypothetical protein P3X46_015422 [Hevea brasiliensis]